MKKLFLLPLLLLAQPVAAQQVYQYPSTDYAAGSWTPSLLFGGAAVGLTYTTQTGNYVRIGKRVIFDFQVLLSALGSSTGAATITGLPFAASAVSAGTFECGFTAGLATATSISGYIQTTAVLNLQIPGAAATANATNANFTASSNFTCTGTYQTP